MIFRTTMEEIVVRADADKKTLEFTIHWKGGVHTQLMMERPRSAAETATPVEALVTAQELFRIGRGDRVVPLGERCVSGDSQFA